MMYDPSDQLSLVDSWETLRRSLLQIDPDFGRQLKATHQRDWKCVGGRERAVLAIAAALDMDAGNPAGRRQARQILSSLEDDGFLSTVDPDSMSIREECSPSYGDIAERRRRELGKDLDWIVSGKFTGNLAECAGPVAALALIQKRTKCLRGNRSARFLHSLGYEILVPDRGKRRWMHRFGLLEDEKDTVENRCRALRAAIELSTKLETALSEIEDVLSVFTGSRNADGRLAFCTAKPRCPECPLKPHCLYAGFRDRHGLSEEGAPTRRLTEAILPEDRPREKLARDGAGTLTDAELLAILIRTGDGKKHAVEVANDVMRQAGTLERLSKSSVAELARHPGLGPVKAITIKAGLELARRLSDRPKDELPAIGSARDVYALLRGYFLERQKELIVCLLLNMKHRVLRQVVITEGTLNQSVLHPREAFQEAIRDGAAGVIFVHNHPSGDPAPSRDDRAVTKRLVEVGRLVGIQVVDHVIIAHDSFFSFSEAGILDPGK